MNHRSSLSDQALVKDNHVLAAGGAVQAFEAVRRRYPTVGAGRGDLAEQLTDLLAAGADSVLLDNMDCDEMREAVAVNAGRAKLGRPAGSPSSAPARSPSPGSTTSRWAR